MKRTFTILLSLFLLSSVYGQFEHRKSTIADEFPGIDITGLSSQIQKASQSTTSSRYANPLFQDLRKYKLDSLVTEGYNSEGGHSPAEKSEYQYNDDGKLTMILDYHWDSAAWKVNSKMEYTYFDENNHLLVSDYDYWYDSVWNIFAKIHYYYDNQNNETLRIDSVYSYLQNHWLIAQKIESEYDDQGNKVVYHATVYRNNQIDRQTEYRYSYDNLNRRVLFILSRTLSDTNVLIPNYRFEYSYDVGSNLINTMASTWQADSSTWTLIWKEDYTYNNSGQVISEITSDYLSYTNDWDYRSKCDYTYDAHNNPEVESSYYWDDLSNQWEVESKKEHLYDDTKTISEVNVPSMNVFEQDYPDYIVNTPVYYIYSELWVDDLQIKYANSYYYSATNLGVSTHSENKFRIFPNPASDRLYVSTEQLDDSSIKYVVYTSTGQTAISEQKYQNCIEIGELTPGLYLLEISASHSKTRMKFIKR